MQKTKLKTLAPLTRNQVIFTVRKLTGLSPRTIDADIKRLGIKTLGNTRTRPSRYDVNAPWVVLYDRGYPVAWEKLLPKFAVTPKGKAKR